MSSVRLNVMEETVPPNSHSVLVTARPMPKGIKDALWRTMGSRLRSLGVDARLSQRQIAAAAGLFQTAVSKIELGQTAPRLDVVARLAAGLKISATWLAYGDVGHLRFNHRRAPPTVPPDPPVPDLGTREPDAAYLEVGVRARRARQLRGLALRPVAKAAAMSPTSILLIEEGQSIPLVSTCEALAVALNVAPGWLAFGEGEGPDAAE